MLRCRQGPWRPARPPDGFDRTQQQGPRGEQRAGQAGACRHADPILGNPGVAMRLPTSEHVVNDASAAPEPALDGEPVARRPAGLDGATRGCDDVLHDGQAKARPTRSTRTVTPVEALEETRQIVRIDPHAVVSGSDDHVAAILANRQREGRPGTGIAKRVLGQVLDDHLQHSRPQRDRPLPAPRETRA